MGQGRAARLVPVVLVPAALVLAIAACSPAAPGRAGPPPGGSGPESTTSTVASQYSHAQVLGWVTPTLDNGISLVRSVAPGSTDAQLLVAAGNLATACAVSAHELGQTTWAGTAGREEAALATTLGRVQELVAQPPAAGLADQLGGDIQTLTQQLQALRQDALT